MLPLKQESPIPGPVRNQASQQEVSGGLASEASSSVPHRLHYCLNHPLTLVHGAKKVGDHCFLLCVSVALLYHLKWMDLSHSNDLFLIWLLCKVPTSNSMIFTGTGIGTWTYLFEGHSSTPSRCPEDMANRPVTDEGGDINLQRKPFPINSVERKYQFGLTVCQFLLSLFFSDSNVFFLKSCKFTT